MARSRSERADLTMPVGRIDSMLKSGNFASRVAKAAPVFIAAVLQYLVSELIDVAGSTAHEDHQKLITPRYLNLAIRNDEELSQLLHSATIAGGGVNKPLIFGLSAMRRRRKRTSPERAAAKKRKKKKKKKRMERNWRWIMASGGPLG